MCAAAEQGDPHGEEREHLLQLGEGWAGEEQEEEQLPLEQEAQEPEER